MKRAQFLTWKAHCAQKGHFKHMCLPNFQNFYIHSQFNYLQIKFRLDICGYNINSNHNIGQN